MAKLNFPDPQDALVYQDAGLTWTWNNALGVWSTEGGAQTPDLSYTAPGGVKRSIQNRLADYVSPLDYGAKGDGVNDDTDALEQALKTGRPVDGLGYIYKTTRNVVIDNLHSLKDCTITRPDLGLEDQGFVLKIRNDGFLIDNVTFIYGESPNRATTGSNGGLFQYLGLSVNNAEKFTVRNCKFTGNGSGSHLLTKQCSHFNIEGCKVYDSQAFDSSANDDLMHGIIAQECQEFSISNCIVKNLTHNNGSGYKNINTRGIATSQSQQFSITGCHSEFVSQGFDLTGSVENKYFSVSACTANECALYGFKSANNPTMGIFADCVAVKSGYVGFVASAGDPEPPYAARFITFNGCKAVETGYATGMPTRSDARGFSVMNGSGSNEAYPLRVEMNNCCVIQESTSLDTAFASSQSIDNIDQNASNWATPAVGTITQNCKIYEDTPGLINNNYSGSIGPMYCRLGLNGDQSISPGDFRSIDWEKELSGINPADPFNLWNDNGDNKDRIYIRETGIYSITINIGTSERPGNLLMRLIRNGTSPMQDTYTTIAGIDQGVPSHINLNWTGVLRDDSYITAQIQAYENITIQQGRSSFSIIRIA